MARRGRPVVRYPGRACQAPLCGNRVAAGVGHLCRKHFDLHRRFGDWRATKVRTKTVQPHMDLVLELMAPHDDHKAVRVAIAIATFHMDAQQAPPNCRAFAEWAGRYDVRWEPLRFAAGLLGACWWGIRLGDFGPGDAYHYQVVKMASRFALGTATTRYENGTGKPQYRPLLPPRLSAVYAGRSMVDQLAPLLRALDEPIRKTLEDRRPAKEKLKQHADDFGNSVLNQALRG